MRSGSHPGLFLGADYSRKAESIQDGLWGALDQIHYEGVQEYLWEAGLKIWYHFMRRKRYPVFYFWGGQVIQDHYDKPRIVCGAGDYVHYEGIQEYLWGRGLKMQDRYEKQWVLRIIFWGCW